MKVSESLMFYTWILVTGLVNSQTPNCPGWFGTCQYKCRCTSSCASDGSCNGAGTCQTGWFGPACQYADVASSVTMVTQSGTVQNLITDGNDTSCNTDKTTQTLTLTWNQSYLLTWLRVYATNIGSLPNLTVQFSSNTSGVPYLNVTCVKNVIFNNPSMDMFCDLRVPVNQVVLTGETVKSLCSLYISGGRNVALHQSTSQSSIYNDSIIHGSDKAVDGDNRGNFSKSCSCVSNAGHQFWYTNLSRPATVSRYVLYNRLELYTQKRLKGFQLTSFNVQGNQMYNYTDRNNETQNVYTMIPAKPTSAVSSVNIQGHSPDNFFTVCEAEIYGETECVAGKYGRECENTCNCADTGEQCYVSTGGCPSGCASGYHGEDCKQPCPDGTYGQDCMFNCSRTCDVTGNSRTCDRVNGTCLLGCQPGYYGDKCEKVCPKGTFGKDCLTNCSHFCVPDKNGVSVCDHINGTCLKGCQVGYTSHRCDETCPNETYGQDCKHNCSMTCDVNGKNRICDHVNGTCLQGCQDGYFGDECRKVCTNGTFGKDCLGNCSHFCVLDNNDVSICDHVNGTCQDGCQDGYTTPWCNKTCDAGWFGLSCRYKCRCNTTTCESDGSCFPGSHCQPGWFGPSCQYADVAYNVPVTVQPGTQEMLNITDGNDDTCNTETASHSLTLTWNQTYLLTWMRLYANSVGSLPSLTVQFSPDKGSTFLNVTCTRSITVNSQSMDMFCDLSIPVNQVVLTGKAIMSLCSLYISGGRNVALLQQTSQSSTYSDGSRLFGSEKAVDGNTNGDFDIGLSCTATSTSNDPDWSVRISRPVTVYRYVLYNRVDGSFSIRLQGFTLNSYNVSGVHVYNYTDPNGPAQSVYTLLPGTPTLSVSRVKIYLAGLNELLTLCEVEIYGDMECVDGRYGLDCKQTCNCDGTRNNCYVSTGGCPSGCVVGYHGENCKQICPKETYGQSCRFNCSTSCLTTVSTNRICDHVSGTCLQGCQDGYHGAKCETKCPKDKFGKNCNGSCSSYCMTVSSNTSSCNHINGACQNGCHDGYISSLCNQSCPKGQYGKDCGYNCSKFCAPIDSSGISNCDHTNGACLMGCLPDYDGVRCDNNNKSPDVGAIVGAVLGSTVAIVIVVVAAIILWRRRKSKTSGEDQYSRNEGYHNVVNNRGTELNNLDNTGASQKESKSKRADNFAAGNSGVYYNTLPEVSSTVIQLKDLEAFLATHDRSFYQEQFSTIPVNCGATTEVAQKPENKKKNRYKNVCAYDHSRVHLMTSGNNLQDDYINASHIKGYNGESFIASQGPTKTTLEDFVRMLWEQQTEEVVMLTNLIEQGKDKCERYWPEDGEMKVGEITVKLTTSHVFADYTIRRLQLAKTGKPNHRVTHFHFTAWPDLDVPVTPWGLVDFEQRVASYPTSKPIVVHCSAGVGRTGTFIALRNVMRQAEDKGYLDIFTTVQKLRHDRINMVQTAFQYQFLHRAAQVAMLCMGTTVASGDIGSRLNYLEEVSDSGLTNMEKEFKTICELSNNDYTDKDVDESAADDGTNIYENSCNVINKHKNRLNNIIPKTLYAPILHCETDYLGDYINAVFVPSFSKQNQQFLTQLPLPTTVVDFWRLVTQYNVSFIVSFEDDLKHTDLTVGAYLPSTDKQAVIFSLFELESETVSTNKLWQQRRVTVTADTEYKNSKLSTSAALKEELVVTHLKCMTTNLDPENLLTLIEQIRSLSPGSESRTVYTCRNGADYSGLVCVLSLLLDRMDHDGCSTVPLVVGAIKAIRPQVIPTLIGYRGQKGNKPAEMEITYD